MDKKKIEKIGQKFRQQMQEIVDESNGRITSISIEVGGEKRTIAEKKQKQGSDNGK